MKAFVVFTEDDWGPGRCKVCRLRGTALCLEKSYCPMGSGAVECKSISHWPAWDYLAFLVDQGDINRAGVDNALESAIISCDERGKAEKHDTHGADAARSGEGGPPACDAGIPAGVAGGEGQRVEGTVSVVYRAGNDGVEVVSKNEITPGDREGVGNKAGFSAQDTGPAKPEKLSGGPGEPGGDSGEHGSESGDTGAAADIRGGREG